MSIYAAEVKITHEEDRAECHDDPLQERQGLPLHEVRYIITISHHLIKIYFLLQFSVHIWVAKVIPGLTKQIFVNCVVVVPRFTGCSAASTFNKGILNLDMCVK